MMRLGEGLFYLGTVGKPGVLSTYLVGANDEYALVEPGPSNTVDETLSLLKDVGAHPEAVKYLVATHVHLDHAGGAWKMMDRLPNARVVVYNGGGRHLIDPRKLVIGAASVLGPLYELWGEMRPLPAERIVEVDDQEVLNVGGRHLQVLYAPGHAPYHMAVLDKETKSIFTGDAVGMYVQERDTLWPASPLPSFRYEESMETLKRLQDESPRLLLIPHYGPQADVGRLFELNRFIYKKWYQIIGSEPADASASRVVKDLFGSIPSYSWVPADELTTWIITMHATGFKDYFNRKRSGH
jgi:glyoxylase-like metal-dependent hydrolase (beta-lactamase superfamily II)